jgi:hypothetical protein
MKRDPSRREMIGAVGLVATAAVMAKGDDKPDKKYNDGDVLFGKPSLTSTQSLDPAAVAINVSPDAHAFTLLFGDPVKGDLQIGLGGSNEPLSMVKLVTIQIPVKSIGEKSRLIGYGQDIRGYIPKSKESRVVLTADCGGTTKVVEYPYGQEILGEDYTISFFSPDNRFLGDPQPLPVPQYSATLTLQVQVRAAGEAVLAAIDSLNVEAQLVEAPSPPRPTPEDPFKDRRKGRRNRNA